jgi:sulfite oxidase
VYDVTKFVPEHPGSKNILLGAGGAIDPFWHIYQQHNTPEIRAILERYRIGNLNPKDQVSTEDLDNPWANEPHRHPILKSASKTPYNAEPPLNLLAEHFITPS